MFPTTRRSLGWYIATYLPVCNVMYRGTYIHSLDASKKYDFFCQVGEMAKLETYKRAQYNNAAMTITRAMIRHSQRFCLARRSNYYNTRSSREIATYRNLRRATLSSESRTQRKAKSNPGKHIPVPPDMAKKRSLPLAPSNAHFLKKRWHSTFSQFDFKDIDLREHIMNTEPSRGINPTAERRRQSLIASQCDPNATYPSLTPRGGTDIWGTMMQGNQIKMRDPMSLSSLSSTSMSRLSALDHCHVKEENTTHTKQTGDSFSMDLLIKKMDNVIRKQRSFEDNISAMHAHLYTIGAVIKDKR